MKKITAEEFVKLVNERDSAEFISMDVQTEPKMRKTGNPYLGCTKSSTISGILGFDYETSVNNQLAREDKEQIFEVKSRPWGVRIDRHWVTHKDNLYLSVKVEGASEPIYLKDGSKISDEDIKPFIYERSEPKSQTEVGVEKAVKYMDINVNNIQLVRIRGEEYMILH